MNKQLHYLFILFTSIISFVAPVKAQTLSKGSGTEHDPYLIESSNDLKLMFIIVDLGNSCENQYFKVTANIDGASPIGNSTYPFKGVFDGDNNTITCKNGALFGVLENAIIKNVIVQGDNEYSSTSSVGGIACSASNTEFRNCHMKGSINWKGYYGDLYIGGIVGTAAKNTRFIYCSNHATINVYPNSSYDYGDIVVVGGISGSGGNVVACYNAGDILISSSNTRSSTYMARGIGGSTIHMCYNIAEIIVKAGHKDANSSDATCYAAGIGGSTISYCYNRGYISAYSQTNNVAHPDVAGGIHTGNSSAQISCCYNTGSVSANFKGYIGAQLYSGNSSYNGTNCYGYASNELNIYGEYFCDKLNKDSAVFCADIIPNINNGYPIFSYQFSKVIVDANYTFMGSVSGSTNCAIGSLITISATPKDGFQFVQWNDGNTDPIRTVKTTMGNNYYTAIFVSKSHTITWKNDDGSIIDQTLVDYGTTPVYGGAVPTKPADAQYTYTFDGWSPNIHPVQGDDVYTAVFSKTVNQYTVTFKNHDGSVLQSTSVAYGETPVYAGTAPTKPATDQYTYTFSGWDKEIASVTGDVVYTAQFEATVNKYTVTFNNWDGTPLATYEVEYGQTPEYSGELPTKAATDEYTYTFSAWTPAIVAVTGNVTYTAEFVEEGKIGPTWQILYTSTNGNSITPTKTDVFGANIVSNTYQDGQGVITFDGPVKSIGENAFSGCRSLTSITIPESVTSIGGSAFSGCSSLTSITIPNSVTSIGNYVFSSCYSLTSMVVGSGNTTYDSRENCNAIIEKATNTLIAGCQNTTIPNSVTSIGWAAFNGCSSLTSITIPNSVTSIGVSAFWYCSSLASVTIPTSVTSIGEVAFNGCTSLTSVTIPNSVTSIGYAAFSGCTSLTSIAIPNSVTSIGDAAFGDCTSLTSVTIGSGVTSIGSYAFEDCTSLTSITIPESVTSIGESAFSGCDNLKTVYVKAQEPPVLGE